MLILELDVVKSKHEVLIAHGDEVLALLAADTDVADIATLLLEARVLKRCGETARVGALYAHLTELECEDRAGLGDDVVELVVHVLAVNLEPIGLKIPNKKRYEVVDELDGLFGSCKAESGVVNHNRKCIG